MAFRLGTKKVYFPNLIFTMVRSDLPPNQVAFRVRPNVNKLDVRDYLLNVYGVQTLDVRTVLFPGRERRHALPSGRQYTKRDPVMKKVIVTLAEPFPYPAVPDINRDFGGEESHNQAERMRYKLRGWKPEKQATDEAVKEKAATA